jgi:hypothetical protein
VKRTTREKVGVARLFIDRARLGKVAFDEQSMRLDSAKEVMKFG